jgi:hypothetical protein
MRAHLGLPEDHFSWQWASDDDHCEWDSVGCTDTGRVRKAFNSDDKMTGTIPEAISSLEMLDEM